MLDFQHNLLTSVLVIALAVIGLMSGVLMIGHLRSGVDRIGAAGDGSVPPVTVAEADAGLQAFDHYATITQRPLFFPDRRLPVLVQAIDELGPEPVPEAEPDPIDPLKAVIAGVIITPELKLALVNDQEAGKVMILREGMSLEGPQAAWRLTDIQQRGVDFESSDGQRSTLELTVYTDNLVAGDSGMAGRQRAVEAATRAEFEAEISEEDTEAARSRAEEIRQRVAERRAELRAEADRRARQQEEGGP
jgi:general secretion pathway protein N